MSRYKFTGKKIDKHTGNRVQKITLYPEIRIGDGDQFVYPIDGDRLENLAYRYYGDSNLWWIIAKANEMSKGQISPNPEIKLRITEFGVLITLKVRT